MLAVYEDPGTATPTYLDILFGWDLNGTEVKATASAVTNEGANMVVTVEDLDQETEYMVYGIAIPMDASPFYVNPYPAPVASTAVITTATETMAPPDSQDTTGTSAMALAFTALLLALI